MLTYKQIITIDYLDGLDREVVFWAAQYACRQNVDLWRLVFDNYNKENQQ